ncbi:hypothetical protein OS493_033326 [Desmophyllum pertusum]|uniref:ShKT domain-containing protein n=1 Tax=Desmophyllum pertusum TaxID=174260 RepID=A0A9W9Z9T1_9CNID|nr:hypothetical protein OS493_033326 [Desmophyllum pertusum]
MTWLNFTVLCCWSLWFIVSLAASCSDRGYFCWVWKTAGKCKLSSEYAVEKCQKTCNFCPVPTEILPTTEASPSQITTGISPTPAPKPECHLARLPISRERFWDQQLKGHVIRRQSVISELQCEDLCLRLSRCVAYNYQYSGIERGEGGAGKTCELLNEVAVIEDRVGYSFRLFERERAIKNLLSSCLGDT